VSVSQFSNEDTTYVNHRGIKRESPDAKLFITEFGELWILKQFLQTHDNKMFAIPTWLAKKKGIKLQNYGSFR